MGFFQVSSTMPLTAWQLQRCHLFKAHWIDVIDIDNLIIRNCYNQLIISFINNQLTLILESFWLIQVRCDPTTSRWVVGYLIGTPKAIHPSGFRALMFQDIPSPDKSLQSVHRIPFSSFFSGGSTQMIGFFSWLLVSDFEGTFNSCSRPK